MKFNPLRFNRRAFTLVEVLVVIAIIGVILGMMIPGIQGMREMSRRSMCQRNLMELSLALSSYHEVNAHYPIGTINPSGPILSKPEGFHHNWITGILTQLDSSLLAQRIDSSVGVYAPENAVVRAASVPVLLCPSASGTADNTTCYAGVHHWEETPIDETNDGVFILNIPTSNDDIVDGLAHTMFLGEKTSVPEFDLGWISGTRSSLRNVGHAINSLNGTWPHRLPPTPPATEDAGLNWEGDFGMEMDQSEFAAEAETDVASEAAPVVGEAAPETEDVDPINPLFVGGFQSEHPSGAHTLMGSGEVTFHSSSMDQRLMQQLANKSDGEIPLSVVDESILQRDDTASEP